MPTIGSSWMIPVAKLKTNDDIYFWEAERMRMRAMQEARNSPWIYPMSMNIGTDFGVSGSASFGGGEITIAGQSVSLEPLKQSAKSIEASPFDGQARKNIEGKIGRLQRAGAVAQAAVLEKQLTTRDSLMKLKEWDYKILTKEAIEAFARNTHVTLYRDGLKLNIEPLETYAGNPRISKPEDRIIPDAVLDKLEEAKERQLFDSFHVLWAERVKDPLLLGAVDGCGDFFFITEWGDDVTFEQITKGKM